jgi:hypothetical protein
MNAKQAIASQYLAALEMLKQTILKCPEALWDDPRDKNRFWQIAYHALFYTHLYLQESESTFTPWPRHRENYQFLGSTPWPPHAPPDIGEAYSPAEVLAYLEVCQEQAKEKVVALDLDAADSGFHWLPFGKLELQLYNLRHLGQHIGELMDRLGTRAAIEVDWVGRGTP